MANMFKFKDTDPRKFAAGVLFRASQEKFPELNSLAVQELRLSPGSIREPHTHPNAHQLDYCLNGSATVGIVAPGGDRQLLKLETGDISFVPQGYLHWIKNEGETDLSFLVVLSSEEPETLEFSEMLRGILPDDGRRMYGIDENVIARMSNTGVIY